MINPDEETIVKGRKRQIKLISTLAFNDLTSCIRHGCFNNSERTFRGVMKMLWVILMVEERGESRPPSSRMDKNTILFHHFYRSPLPYLSPNKFPLTRRHDHKATCHLLNPSQQKCEIRENAGIWRGISK